jgi:hypothetical protein
VGENEKIGGRERLPACACVVFLNANDRSTFRPFTVFMGNAHFLSPHCFNTFLSKIAVDSKHT